MEWKDLFIDLYKIRLRNYSVVGRLSGGRGWDDLGELPGSSPDGSRVIQRVNGVGVLEKNYLIRNIKIRKE